MRTTSCSSLLPERTFASAAISLAFVLQSGKLSAELGRVAIEVSYIVDTTSKMVVRVCREVKVPPIVAALEGVWPTKARCCDITALQRVATKRPNVHAAT